MDPLVFTCPNCNKVKLIAEGIKVSQVQFLPEQVYLPIARPGGLVPTINFFEVKVPQYICTLCAPVGLEA